MGYREAPYKIITRKAPFCENESLCKGQGMNHGVEK